MTSDHGEELGERGGFGHPGLGMYDEELHVPLIVHLPGEAPRRVDDDVTHTDIAPTIAELLGRCRAPLPGRSLVTVVRGERLPPLDGPVTIGPRPPFRAGALIEGPWKLTYVLLNGSYGLYDLRADPREHENLFEARPDVARPLLEKLRHHLGQSR